jgi:hypothetical protein
MNGIPPVTPIDGCVSLAADRDKLKGPANRSPRLVFAVFASAIVHAAVVLLPYLGQSRELSSRSMRAKRPVPGLITLTFLDAPTTEVDRPAESVGPSQPLKLKSSSKSLPEEIPPFADGLLPIPGPVFYATELLSKRPQPVAAVDFDAIEFSGTAAPGRAILKLWIDETGVVTDVRPGGGDLPDDVLKPLIETFKKSKFAPGERGGRAVGAVMLIEVNIDPPLSGR